MGSEARPSWPDAESTVPSSSTRVGGTTATGFAPGPGSYELHPLPEKARSSASLETSPDDEPPPDDEESHPGLSLPPDNMSRAPLLVRSSPAQGTGSYGGLPVLSMSSSPGESDLDSDHVTNQFLQRNKRKGKSKLRQSEPAASSSRKSLNRSQDDSIQSEPVHTTSRNRRRSTKDRSSSSALYEPLEGQEESGLETRFNASSAAPIAAGAPRIFESLQSSSSSSHVDVPDEEEESSSESDELHDLKENGHPSDNSPYAQVRASVAATDDISLSINTPRMWSLSIFFAILGSSTNLFFSLRYPSVSITPIIALLLVHPLGLLWDQLLKRADDPIETFVNGAIQLNGGLSNGSTHANGSRPASGHSARIFSSKDPWKRRLRLWLAQGRWNEKEHCCVYISSNVSFGFAFATDVRENYEIYVPKLIQYRSL